MPIGFLIGEGSGLASALLFYSEARGSPLLSTTLLLLTPLPSMLAGLGWGWLPAALGGVTGGILIAVIVSPTLAIGFFLALGLPVALTAYLAYLSRPQPHDPGQREWYPAGRLLAVMSLYAGALPVLVLPLIGGSYDVLRAPMAEFLERVSSRAAPDLGLKPLTPQQIETLAEYIAGALPGAFAAYWLAIFSGNLYLAGRIARASGRLARDWPDLAAIAYPRGFSLLVALALLASLTPGIIGAAGTSFSGALLFAHLLLGLALMHFIARGRAPWILWFVYAGLFLFEPYAAIVLIMAGLLEPALKLRGRFGISPPSS